MICSFVAVVTVGVVGVVGVVASATVPRYCRLRPASALLEKAVPPPADALLDWCPYEGTAGKVHKTVGDIVPFSITRIGWRFAFLSCIRAQYSAHSKTARHY
jgi:hypothetical protein